MSLALMRPFPRRPICLQLGRGKRLRCTSDGSISKREWICFLKLQKPCGKTEVNFSGGSLGRARCGAWVKAAQSVAACGGRRSRGGWQRGEGRRCVARRGARARLNLLRRHIRCAARERGPGGGDGEWRGLRRIVRAARQQRLAPTRRAHTHERRAREIYSSKIDCFKITGRSKSTETNQKRHKTSQNCPKTGWPTVVC